MLDNLLRGVRVLDLTQNVAGPFCTQILGDFGAEVIKVERPGGGDDTRLWTPPDICGHSSTFMALNRNKQSLCVDLSKPEGADIVGRLAAEADVLVHSMKPGSAENRGLGPDALCEANPRLIYCAISAFGEIGPLAQLPGYDPLMQAFTGIMSVTGNEGDDPVRVSVSLIDMGTGMWAALGILAAYISRLQTGRGLRVNASLLETGMSWMTIFIAGYLASGRSPRKLGSAMSMAAPYQLFRSSDGYVFIAAGNDRLFVKVCDALGCPALVADPRFAANSDRVVNRAALQTEIEARTMKTTSADIVAALRAVGAPCSELNTVEQAINHEQVAALGMVADLSMPGVPGLKTVPLPLRVNGERAGALQPPPLLGEHTDAILDRLGLDVQERRNLRQAGVVA